jgi:hypothetical protein
MRVISALTTLVMNSVMIIGVAVFNLAFAGGL